MATNKKKNETEIKSCDHYWLRQSLGIDWAERIGTDQVNSPYSTFDILPAQSDLVVLCVSSERANQ